MLSLFYLSLRSFFLFCVVYEGGETPVENLIGQQFGDYRLLRLIGKGGQASVYLGQHLRLKPRHVAIKILHASVSEQDIEAFRQEANTIASLQHPHIVNVLDFDIQRGTPFLVMEYYPDGSLRERHPRGKRVPLATVISYVKQMASALQHAHDHRLIHRDVKAANMLIGRQGEIVLTDFGIAAIAHSTSSIGIQDFAGTVPYMAPEQIKRYPRRESDQYALAVVIYEWLSGELPFIGTPEEIAIKHLTVEPPSLRDILPDFSPPQEQVIFKALAKDPKERFATVQAFAIAFEQAMQGAEPTIPSLGNSSSKHLNQPTVSRPESHLQLDEAVLVESYKAVKDGKITDPETIRSIATNFRAIANDPKASRKVSFDAARAAQNLHKQAADIANVQQDAEKQPSRQMQHSTRENMQAAVHRSRQQRSSARNKEFGRWHRVFSILLLSFSLLLFGTLTVFRATPALKGINAFFLALLGWFAYPFVLGLIALAVVKLIEGIRRQSLVVRPPLVGECLILLLLLLECRLIMGHMGVLAELLVRPLLGWPDIDAHIIVLGLLLITCVFTFRITIVHILLFVRFMRHLLDKAPSVLTRQNEEPSPFLGQRPQFSRYSNRADVGEDDEEKR